MLSISKVQTPLNATIEKITPILAESYLERNQLGNRHVTMRRVRLYAQMMREGKWELNGEAIIFDEDGHLMNGQHRLKCLRPAQM